MKKPETIFNKGITLKKKYGKAKAIEILTADKARFERNKKFKESVDCYAVIQRLKSGQI
jgi:hypothetical protein